MKRYSQSQLPAFRKPNMRRSKNMRAIRSCGNKTTEGRLASLLKARGIRGLRRQPQRIVGKPDFVIRQKRLAIFVDGCFFHGCPRCGHIPRTNRAYWTAKIARNKRRDNAVSKALRALGYRVTRIWECRLRKDPNRCLRRILRAIKLGHHRKNRILAAPA
jgi:DNA mismatch endonuclease (patch repair protein)